MKKCAILSILALFIFLTACDFSKQKGTQNPSDRSQAVVSFQTLMTDVISPRCLQCHSGGSAKAGVNLESFESVFSNMSRIYSVACEDRSMPPNGALSGSQMSELENWIDSGGPQNGGTPIPVPSSSASATPQPDDTGLVPTYESIRGQVFVPRCQTCHGPNGSHPNIALFDEDQLMNPANGWVVAGAPEKSSLYEAITKTGKGRMPPASSGAALTEKEIQTIQAWIMSAGSPTPTPTPSTSPVLPTFSSINNGIFASRCESCHTIGGEAEDVDLSDWDELTNTSHNWVVPGHPTSSSLYDRITRTGKGRMPPMSEGSALSADEIAAIRAWIQAGAQNN